MKHEIEFILPIKPTGELGLNSLYSTNKHWAKRNKQAKAIHESVRIAMKSQGIPKRFFEFPVTVDIAYNSRLDIDNHGYLAKLIIDGMKGYVIQDDSKKYVRKLTQEFWNHPGIQVRVLGE